MAWRKKSPEGQRRKHPRVWLPDERTFAAAVLRHGNRARAAREARPETTVENSAAVGHMMFHRPHIKAYIQDENLRILARYGVSAETITAELAKIGFGSIAAFIQKNGAGESVLNIDDANELELAMIAEATVETYMDGKGEDACPVKSIKVKLMPKIQALELLGKKLKMFTDKVEHSGTINMPIMPDDADL